MKSILNYKMLLQTMKNTPLYIIFTQACKYLSEQEVNDLKDKLSKTNNKQGKIFLRIFLQNFDIEVFKDKPLILEDIWLYNYIKYEITEKKIPRRGLIEMYEKKIFNNK